MGASTKRLLLVFLLISFLAKSQEKKDWYSFFGEIPKTVSKRYYDQLKNSENLLDKARIIDTIASIHIQSGTTDSIIYYGNLLEEQISAEKDSFEAYDLYLSKAYHILGKGKLEKGLFDDAMKHYLDGIAISPVSEMEKMHYIHQLGLGTVYLYQKEYDSALSIFENCISKTKDTDILLFAKKLVADTFFFRNDFSKAKSIYLEVLEGLKIYENNKIRLQTQLKLGRIDIFENNLPHALEYFRSVKEVALESKFYDLYIDAVIQMGVVYYNQGYAQDAEIVLSSAYVNTVQWNKLELQRDVINVLKDLKVADKDYENAYNLMTQYLSISNQILTNQNKAIVKEMEVKYQTLEKEKEILALKEEQLLKESEIERQRTIKKAFLIGFLAVLLPVIALLLVYFQKLKTQIALNKSQEEVNSQKVHALMIDQELNLINATMDGQNRERKRLARELHDSIGGNLASIKLQISGANDQESFQSKIIKQIDETYHQVRDISHNLASKKFQDNGVSSLIKEYVNNIENGSNQKISFNPYPEEKINEIESPLKEELFKIIQELLTNTLKHAQADQVDIYLNRYQTILQLLFEDNGVGFDTSKTGEGIGFENIRNRLKLLSGNLMIDSTINRGTVINIEIPVS
ncbi:tetratricopeptide repeat-containing sensor histidine kinase [Aquimarina litoralis]|uniref:tetratricopeptide repeat-containing sensor histidine kinase n=1 Tax=Aquimarina litoralis TaxID=584605 RepID=UPI001C569793|nr:histidine kinase [Aquimarina litoralis]MBW1298429.1 histidine kinase [Aquimarina litoralis]